MAHATAVQMKIAMIAAIRFNMVICASTLSAAPQATSSSWHCQVLFNVKYKLCAILPRSMQGRTSVRPPYSFLPSRYPEPSFRAKRGISLHFFFPSLRPSTVNCQPAGLELPRDTELC